MSQNSKTLIGALVAAALAIAVYYGVIGQQTATNIQTQTNQALGTGPAGAPTTGPGTVPNSTVPNTTVPGQAAPVPAPASTTRP